MNWIIDILAILLVFGLSFYGWRKGFFKSTVDLLLVIIVIGGSIALSAITVAYVLTPLGVVDELNYAFLDLLGNSKIEGGQEIIEMVAYYLSVSVLGIVLFVIFDVLLHFIRRLILKLFEKTLFRIKLIKFVDKLLGLLVNLIISLAVVLSLMALVHTFSNDGGFVGFINELFKSCEVLGIFYDINPLNSLFELMVV